ncbi:MAG: restriction endonuclease subunit S [bacterium]
MEKNNKTLNVPNLRFPEFKDEWIEYKLKDNFIFKNGLNKEKESFGFGTPIVNYMDVNKNRFLYTDNIKGLVNVNEKELENYSVEKGDVFFTRTSETSDEIGLSSVILDKTEKTVFSGFVLRARPFTNNLLPEFCAYSFSNKRVRNEIIKKSSITTRALTSGTSLNEVINFYPSLDEQIKISSLMILLERKIQTQMKIIDNYESLIYILRKRLLSSVGGNFVLLSSISEIYQPQTISKDQFDKNGFYLVYGANGVIGRYNQYNHENSQVCISCRGESCGAVTFTCEKSWITGNSMVINFDNNTNISKKFMYYYLKNINFKNIISGSGQPQITRTPLQKMKIKLPAIEHQKYIVNILDCVNNYRNTLEISNDNLRSTKKYLLENIFI